MCDGDVSNLQGVRPFDRMMMSRGNPTEKASPAPKATYSVWGTNHNYYNTEWQTSDSDGCIGSANGALFPPATGSSGQTSAGLSGILAFFRGVLATGTAGGYLPDAIRNFDIPGFGAATTLEFRVARRVVIPAPLKDKNGNCHLVTPLRTDPLNQGATTSFSILLEGTDGTMSGPVNVQDHMVGASLAGPVGMLTYGAPTISPILQTVRIALGDFPNSSGILRRLKGVRFTFDRTASGAIYLANIRFGKTATPPVLPGATSTPLAVDSWPPAPAGRTLRTQGGTFTASITSIRSVASSPARNGASGVEIEISSDRPFPTRDAMLTLQVGRRTFHLSSHPDGDRTRVVFTLGDDEFASIPDGSGASIRFGDSLSEPAVEVGRIVHPR